MISLLESKLRLEDERCGELLLNDSLRRDDDDALVLPLLFVPRPLLLFCLVKALRKADKPLPEGVLAGGERPVIIKLRALELRGKAAADRPFPEPNLREESDRPGSRRDRLLPSLPYFFWKSDQFSPDPEVDDGA